MSDSTSNARAGKTGMYDSRIEDLLLAIGRRAREALDTLESLQVRVPVKPVPATPLPSPPRLGEHSSGWTRSGWLCCQKSAGAVFGNIAALLAPDEMVHLIQAGEQWAAQAEAAVEQRRVQIARAEAAWEETYACHLRDLSQRCDDFDLAKSITLEVEPNDD